MAMKSQNTSREHTEGPKRNIEKKQKVPHISAFIYSATLYFTFCVEDKKKNGIFFLEGIT